VSDIQKYLVGIDGGTQSTKVIVFDVFGNIITQAKVALQALHQPEHGIAEHPSDDLWTTLKTACKQAVTQLGDSQYEILAIGLCSIRCCRAELNEYGELVSPVLNWKDLRLARAYQPKDPKNFKAAHEQNPKAHYVTTASGYLTHRLTGKARDTAANYEGMWPINKATWQWSTDTKLIDSCGIPKEMLFELCNPGSILGRLSSKASEQTGFPVGTPVVATANDKAVEALGAGLNDPHTDSHTALISLGTYIGAMVKGEFNKAGSAHHFTNMSAIPNQYLFETAGVRNGMGIISWFRDLLGNGLEQEARDQHCSPEELLDQEASEVSAGCDGLICVPEWLPPTDKLYKRGAFIGLHGGHTRAHLHRALLESIALTMNNNLNAMLHHFGRETKQIIVSGGGAKSNVFAQIFADVTGKPVQRSTVTDAAALGSAICAAVAIGYYDSFSSASSCMVKTGTSVTPKLDNFRLYQQLNDQAFQCASSHTDKILSKLQPIFNINIPPVEELTE